jgi:hypothetical protein
MVFVTISRNSDDIGIDEWSELISKLDYLETVPDRTIKISSIDESFIEPGLGKAKYFEDGSDVGVASLENGKVLTTCIPIEICAEIAAHLTANMEIFIEAKNHKK